MNSKDLPSAISSPALACGHSPCAGQAGQTTDPSGLEAVLASHSARQVRAVGLLTSGTYGRRSFTSSSSASLQQSLENRLRAKTQSLGSTLYKMTWKQWVMPSGLSRFRLRASVLRTSETGCTGRVTPAARDWKDTPGRVAQRDGKDRLDQLPRQAYLAGWPTPSCNNDRTGNEQSAVHMTREDGSKVQQRLQDFAVIAGWGTPTASEPGGTAEAYVARSIEKTGNTTPTMLAHQVQIAGWPTTRAVDGEKNLRTLDGALREIARKGGGPAGRGIGGSDLRAGPTNGYWGDADWLPCRDGKWRPVEPGFEQMADGSSSSLGRVCADAIEEIEREVNDWEIRYQTVAAEGLLRVWRDLQSQALCERETGRFSGVQSPSVLLAFLRQLTEQGWRFSDALACSRSGASEILLRVLRFDGEAARTPLRRELAEQLRGEPADPLRELSSVLAHYATYCWGEACRKKAGAASFPLTNDATSRAGRLRAYGNAINAQAAQAFIEATGL